MSRVGRPFVVCLSLSLAFAGAGATAADETYRYRSLGVSDGLSQGFVTAIAQDPDGFLWFGSLSGLDRYDGRRFERHAHAPDDPSSLGAGAIYAMHVDRSGRLWVATESGLDRFEPAAESFVHYTSDPEDSRTSAPGRVRFIDSDSTGRVWFGSSALNRLDPASGIVSRFPIENPGDRELTLVSVDSADRLWIATAALDRARAAQGAPALVAYDLARTGGGGALPPPLLRAPLPPGTLEVLAVAEDRSGRVWWGLDGGGLLRFDPASGAWTRLDPQHDGREDFLRASVRSLAVDTDGAIWALVSADSLRGGQGPVALYRIDPEILTATPIDLGPEIAGPGDSAPLMSLAVDRSGVLWLSTNAGGLRYVDVSARGFHLYRSGYPLAFGSDFVRAILKSADGALWIGTPAGVHRIDRSTGETRSSGVDGFLPLPGPNVQSILEDRQGRIWVGTASGLARLDPVTGKVDHFRHDAANPASLSDDWVLTIHEDAQGTLWFGGFRGLDALDAETGRFVHHRALPEDPTTLPDETVAALYDDHAGRLWVGTGAGLATGSGGPPGPVRFRRVPIAGGGAGEGEVSAIRERQEEPGVLWLGHLGQGLTRLETATGAARHYTTRNSDLPDDTVYAILDDPDGRLWMSTNRGLVRFDPDAGAFTTFGLDRGLQSLEFNARSYFSSDDGEMFFGGVAGFNAFRPEEIRPNAIAPEVRITHVSALDRSGASPIAPFELLFRRGMPAGSLTLDSRQRDVRFEFAALHFSHPESNRFSYFLQGYDSAWRPATTIQEATYTNLAPGRYTFRVRAMSSHGVWSEGSDSISFTIRPPFYATPWFYALSGLAFAGALAGVYFWRLGELHRRQRNLELEVASRTAELSRTLTLVEEQAGKLQELDRAKSRFFANVSHEFRTPLTLTLGPLEDLLRGRHGPLSKDAVAELELALRNTRRQAQLVDRLLMLAALDAGSLKLRLAHRRLDELVRFVAAPFESHAKRLGLDLRVEIPPDALWARCDEEKVEQVLGNLLSNACKYTPRGGHIEVRLQGSGTVASIEVADSGIGIPEESLLRIFDRFYRVGSEGRGQPGTGIGLSLAKELVELHGGSLRAESRPGAGSRFTVELPIADGGPAPGPEAAEALQEPQGAPSGFLPSAPGEFEDGEQATGASEPASGERPEILVVDDHPEMRAFLRRQLEEGYQIAEAEDGAEALRRASERVPDLIVSDVSMDGMDGFALCRAVRADPELEHVPVVLLTARADLESRIEGLEGGADDYLVKPFESRELLARVRNLLEVRARLRNVLVPERPRAVPAPEPVAASSADEVFLERLQEVLNRHAFEETFSVTELARRLAVGRTHLYRRLEEVCAASPSEVIFDFRLERAAQLLARRAGNVGEVAYAVGFKNVSHFVRRFRERYGTTPAAYASGARRDP